MPIFKLKPASDLAHHAIEDGDDLALSCSQRDVASVSGNFWDSTRSRLMLNKKPSKIQRDTSGKTATTAATTATSNSSTSPPKNRRSTLRWKKLRKRKQCSKKGLSQRDGDLSSLRYTESSANKTSGGFLSVPIRASGIRSSVKSSISQQVSIRSSRLDAATNERLLQRKNAEVVGRPSMASTEWVGTTSFSSSDGEEESEDASGKSGPLLGAPATSIRVSKGRSRRQSAFRTQMSSQWTLSALTDPSKRGHFEWGNMSGLTTGQWTNYDQDSMRSCGSGVCTNGMYIYSQPPMASIEDIDCSESDSDEDSDSVGSGSMDGEDHCVSACILTRANSRMERYLSMAGRNHPQQFSSNQNLALLTRTSQDDSMLSLRIGSESRRHLRRHSSVNSSQLEIALPALEEEGPGRHNKPRRRNRAHSDSELDDGHWVYMLRAPPPIDLRRSYESSTLNMALIVPQLRRKSDHMEPVIEIPPSPDALSFTAPPDVPLVPPSSQLRARADSDVLNPTVAAPAEVATPPPPERPLMRRQPSISSSVHSLTPPRMSLSPEKTGIGNDVSAADALSAARRMASGLSVASMLSQSQNKPSQMQEYYWGADASRADHTRKSTGVGAIKILSFQSQATTIFCDDPESEDFDPGVNHMYH